MARVSGTANALLRKIGPTKPAGAYAAVVALAFLYFFRPEDFLTPLHAIPMAKITGVVALVALIFNQMGGGGSTKMPRETKLMLLLLLWLCICIPFAYWITGAFNVVTQKFAKAVITGFLVTMIVRSLPWLRRLVFLQAFAVVLIVAIAFLTHSRDHSGRLALGNGEYDNANDLAMAIAINLPFCMMFMLRARSPFIKAFWGLGVCGLLIGLMATYSRSGFVAAAVAMVLSLWDFGIKGRRFYLVAGVCVLGVLLVVVAPAKYRARLITIFTMEGDSVDPSGASAVHRMELLKQSMGLALKHPIFGVGAGNFPIVAGNWQVAHNTYTELASEAGFPGLFIFILLLRAAYVSIRDARNRAEQTGDRELRLLAGGLWASFATYAVAAFFADSAYQLYVYFLLSYMPCFAYIANAAEINTGPAVAPPSGTRKKIYGRLQPAWLR